MHCTIPFFGWFWFFCLFVLDSQEYIIGYTSEPESSKKGMDDRYKLLHSEFLESKNFMLLQECVLSNVSCFRYSDEKEIFNFR